MRLLKQPVVLGELVVGLLAGNLGYYFGNVTLTILREGDNLSRIASMALTSPYGIGEATSKILPLRDLERDTTFLNETSRGLAATF